MSRIGYGLHLIISPRPGYIRYGKLMRQKGKGLRYAKAKNRTITMKNKRTVRKRKAPKYTGGRLKVLPISKILLIRNPKIRMY